jgi:NAD(P)-dependent dehydrogenase (short-subunit alcohol dehydrogenase family)
MVAGDVRCAGVVGLTESLRLEYRSSGIDFTVVQPAQVETAMLQGQARPRACR